ncbi:MAG: glycosyltransferase family 2 protein [Pseudomonadota bacterium]
MNTDTREPAPRPIVSVIAPAYNEEAVLPEFHRRLVSVFENCDCDLEIVYVNDGSRDGTIAVLRALHAQDPRVTVVDLSRNFGKEIAMTAGFDHACGDAVVVIDTDLQDPPELIPDMIRLWRDGHDVVYAQRTAREGESWFKKATASTFYRLIQRMSRVRIPEDTGDFRLMSRRAVDALLQLREQHRFMKGLFAWVGFPAVALPYRRDPRFAGETKWNYWKLWNFALEGITSFSTVPLKLASYLGLLISIFAFVYAGIVIYKTLVFGEPVQGYPSLMVVVLMLGGIQLASLGIIGEYLGRMFNETKQRPLYFTQALLPSRHAVISQARSPASADSGRA